MSWHCTIQVSVVVVVVVYVCVCVRVCVRVCVCVCVCVCVFVCVWRGVVGSPSNVGGILLLVRLELLRLYGSFDPRVRPLVMAVKHWARSRGINSPPNGTLSSYGVCQWVCVCVRACAQAR
jgi:hypothetical protein